MTGRGNQMNDHPTSFPPFVIFKVANGIKITPLPSIWRGEPGRINDGSEEYVFPTWAEASKWVGDQLKATP